MVYTSFIFTCFFVTIITTLLLAQTYFRVEKKYKGIKRWIVGILLNSFGLIISTLTNDDQGNFMVPFAALLVMVGTLCLVIGTGRFFNKEKRYLDIGILIFVATLLITYFTLFDDQIAIQVTVRSFVLAYISLRGALILFEARSSVSKGNIIISAAFMLVMSIVSVIRMVNAFYPEPDVMTNYVVNSFDYILIQAHYLNFALLSFHFNMLVNQRAWENAEIEEQKFRTIFNNSPYAMLMLSYEDNIILDINTELCNQLGYKRSEIVGKHFSQVKLFDIVKERQSTQNYIKNKVNVVNREVPIIKKNGTVLHSLLSVSILNQLGEKLVVVSFTDITELHHLKERLDRYAYHDTLTELPNRRQFLKYFDLKVENKESFAIVTIDLDDFKKINDEHGHDMGDEILKAIGKRLENILQGNNFAARYGGDEFVLLLAYDDDQEKLSKEIQQVADALKEVFIIGETKFFITASIGTAIYPLHGQKLRELMNKADIAMYQVKHFTKDNLKIFEE